MYLIKITTTTATTTPVFINIDTYIYIGRGHGERKQQTTTKQGETHTIRRDAHCTFTNSRPLYSEPARQATRNCFRSDASAPGENLRRRTYQYKKKKKRRRNEREMVGFGASVSKLAF